ncbi:hypothetical protein MRX96_054336 [Rhipicephalus microplus]
MTLKWLPSGTCPNERPLSIIPPPNLPERSSLQSVASVRAAEFRGIENLSKRDPPMKRCQASREVRSWCRWKKRRVKRSIEASVAEDMADDLHHVLG